MTSRFLAVNLAAPVFLVLGLLFLDEYQDTLIASEIEAMSTQGELIATAIGEGAVVVAKTLRPRRNTPNDEFGPTGAPRVIDTNSAGQLIRNLSNLAHLRAQLFDPKGKLIADTRLMQGPGGAGEVLILDLPPGNEGPAVRFARSIYETTIGRYAYDHSLEPYVEYPKSSAGDYPEATQALNTGQAKSSVRLRSDRQKILSVAMPVQFYKQVVGVLLVSRDGANVAIAAKTAERKSTH
jgi:two-component system sensor histidine kinase ChvG